MQKRAGLDWLALGMVILVAAFFALTARFNSQPAPSFVPAAVLSATGYGLLVTAVRKLHTRTGVGLLEAALGGFLLALFQFLVSLTYPNMGTIITKVPIYSRAFLLTWGLVGLFAIVLSMVGAALGHLAFAPLRPLPTRATKQEEAEESTEVPAEEAAEATETPQRSLEESARARAEETEEEEAPQESEEVKADSEGEHAQATAPARSFVSYVITVLLLSLLPMIFGYVFAAAYDFLMNTINIDRIFPAFYPTLGLLSGLLPWRLAVPLNLTTSQGPFILFALLWRIPDALLGNPNTFDIQALEPLLVNAAALALLLVTMYGREEREKEPQAAPWGVFIGLEALLGLLIILPANLWLQGGLEGVLQLQTFVTQLPTLPLMNNTLFILNLITGPLFCVLVALIVRRQYQLWTQPRVKATEEGEEL